MKLKAHLKVAQTLFRDKYLENKLHMKEEIRLASIVEVTVSLPSHL